MDETFENTEEETAAAPTVSPHEAEIAAARSTKELLDFYATMRDTEPNAEDVARMERLEAAAEARADALEAVVASRAAAKHDEAVLEGMERNPNQAAFNASYDSAATKHWKEIFENAIDPRGPKMPIGIEYRPPQVVAAPGNTDSISVRFNSTKVSDGHYVEQKHIILPRDMFEGVTEEFIAPNKDGKMRLDASYNGGAGAYQVIPFALQGATTTGTNLFPALTRFMPDVEHTIDAVAPLISGGWVDVMATPGDTSMIRYEQIIEDVEPGLATEGQAVAEDDPTWAQVDIGCYQVDSNHSYTRWAEWGSFIRQFPRQLNRTVVKGIMRKGNEYATTGTGVNQPFGLITAVDALANTSGKGAASWASADYSTLVNKAATNPFTPLHLADMQDILDDGAEGMGRTFFMSHKRSFGDMRRALYTTNIGVDNAWMPYFNQQARNAARNIYGEFWGETAVNNRYFSRNFNAGNTTHYIYVDGESFTLRYLPMFININPYRLSDSRRVAIEATLGLDGAFTTSPGEDGFFAARGRTNA